MITPDAAGSAMLEKTLTGADYDSRASSFFRSTSH